MQNDMESIANLQYRMGLDFLNRVNAVNKRTKPKILLDTESYVRNNIECPITTQDIANHLYISRPYLSSTFKKLTGSSLSEYIIKEKVNEAHKLLLYTNKPISEISEGLGFSSQSYFTKTFKKFFGITPKQVRIQQE